MASGLFKKTMVYLGLVDDEYDEADGYEPWAPQTTRQATRVATEEPEEQPPAPASATIRTLTRVTRSSSSARGDPSRPAVVRPIPSDSVQVPRSTSSRRRTSPTARRSPTGSSAASR